MFTSMPEQASSWAPKVDWLNEFITDVALLCTVVITGLALYFAIKYRRGPDNLEGEPIHHNTALETVWTVIPTLVVIFVFSYGFMISREMRNPPANAMEISVDGYSWRWEFTYPDGQKSTGDLVVPIGEPVRLIMRSHDVNHSFYVPALRIKEDLLGSRYTYTWFTPTKLGNFHIFCAEYCGLQHSGMLGTLKIVTREEFADFLLKRSGGEPVPPEELGSRLFSAKGCLQCHSIDGSPKIGPTLQNLFGHQVQLTSGQTVSADENYLRDSILQPQKQVVQGFPPLMPAFEGQLTDEEVKGLIAYIKSLSK